MVLVGSVLLGVLASLVAAELYFWAPTWAERILAAAVARAPTSMRERLNEEWHAELQRAPGHVWKLKFALSLYVWGVQRSRKQINFMRRASRWVALLNTNDINVVLLTWTGISWVFLGLVSLGRYRSWGAMNSVDIIVFGNLVVTGLWTCWIGSRDIFKSLSNRRRDPRT